MLRGITNDIAMSVICYVMLRRITNDIVISVICYVMLRGTTNDIVTSVICNVMLRAITGHYGYLFYMLCNVKKNYWSLWLLMLYVTQRHY